MNTRRLWLRGARWTWCAAVMIAGTLGLGAPAQVPTCGHLELRQALPQQGTVSRVVRWDPDGQAPGAAVLVAAFDREEVANNLNGRGWSVLWLWNGVAWSPLASPMWSVMDMAAGPGGALYALGRSPAPNGLRTVVMRLLNGAWEQVGMLPEHQNMTGVLAEFEGAPVLLRRYPSSGPSVLRWDGAEWRSMGSRPVWNGTSLAVYEGRLYCDGTVMIPGQVAANVARWDGEDWEVVGDQYRGLELGAGLAVANGRLYTGRPFRSWDGNQWTEHADLWPSATVIGAASGLVFVRTSGTRAHSWDGQEWTSYPALSASSGAIMGATEFDDEPVVYGSTTFWPVNDPIYRRSPVVTSVEGANWRPFGPMPDGRVSAIVGFNGGAALLGSFTRIGTRAIVGAAMFDGSRYHPLGAGVRGSITGGLDWAGRLVVYGALTEAGGGPARAVAVWDGASWSTLDEGAPDTGFSRVFKYGGTLAGLRRRIDTLGDGIPALYVLAGARWEALPEPVANASVGSASGSESEIMAAVDLPLGAPPVTSSRVFRWDGTAWTVTNGRYQFYWGVNIEYVAGQFVMVGGNLFDDLNFPHSASRWTGTRWERFPRPLSIGTSPPAPSVLDVDGSVGIYTWGRLNVWDGMDWRALTVGDGWFEIESTAQAWINGRLISSVGPRSRFASPHTNYVAGGLAVVGPGSARVEISRAPFSARVAPRGTLRLSLVATSGAPLGFQWRRNGEPVSDTPWSPMGARVVRGAKGDLLEITNAVIEDSGLYDCVVSDGCQNVVSAAARIRVTRCESDLDASGSVDVMDLFAFLRAWFVRSEEADVDYSGSVTTTDLFVFLSAWFAAC